MVFGILFKSKKIKSTYFYFALDKHIVSLENAKCEVKHTEWGNDKDTGIRVPSKSTFRMYNNEYEVIFYTSLLHSDTSGIKISLLLPKSVVSEQIVRYE